jgi:xanthine dehydrogenase accessory factor
VTGRDDLLRLAADLAGRREPFVTAVVVERRAPSSARVGDRAVITADGAFHGWLGGSCTRPTVLAEARRALADGRPRRIALDPEPDTVERPGVDVFPMTCHSGGSVEIYLEPVLPRPALLVFGVSPVARALAALGNGLGYRVTVADPDAEASDLPGAEVATDLSTLGPFEAPFYAVVATMGEDDEGAILAAAPLDPDYLGVVASARRFGEMRQTLAARGLDAERLDRIRSPAGLDLGARTPEEIALSILAEIVQLRRAKGEAAEEMEPAPAGETPATAIDPICGMTVQVEGARHTAEHDGRTVYFCCGGCRERFLADPAAYSAPTAGSASA